MMSELTKGFTDKAAEKDLFDVRQYIDGFLYKVHGVLAKPVS